MRAGAAERGIDRLQQGLEATGERQQRQVKDPMETPIEFKDPSGRSARYGS